MITSAASHMPRRQEQKAPALNGHRLIKMNYQHNGGTATVNDNRFKIRIIKLQFAVEDIFNYSNAGNVPKRIVIVSNNDQ